jgi:nickel-type superoxide dismutase maturation protease
VRGRLRPLLLASGLLAGLVTALAIARRLDVVEVEGRSMAPALLPGDRLLVESISYARRPPRPGEVVLARDPRHASRELIKRVAVVDRERVHLRGDAPGESTDSRDFGEVAVSSVQWRAIARYWPRRRLALLSGPPAAKRSRRAAVRDRGVRLRGTH